MPVSSHILKCLSACKNQLYENMIDKDFDERAMIQRMNMKVITLVAIMHEIKNNNKKTVFFTPNRC